MTSNFSKPPQDWRNFADKVPLSAMVLNKGDLKRLYKIINDKQIEIRDRFMPVLAQQQTETSGDFEARKKRVYDTFVTSMTIQRFNGEYLHGNDESFLDEANLPDEIRSIFFSTSSVPSSIGIPPISRIVVLLDFTRPPLLDFSRLPNLPTPNESNFEVASDSEDTFAGARARLLDFFETRKAKVNWLHGGAIYDIALFVLGFPFALWVVYRASGLLDAAGNLPNILVSAVFVYIFFLSLNLFRMFYLYSRWVFPKVELSDERSSPLRHRGVWAVITLGVCSAAIWDVVKFFF